MPASKVFAFTAPLEQLQGNLISAAVYIPETILKKLPQQRCRVKGTMNDAAFALAVQYRKNGRSFFTVSGPLRKAAGIRIGDKVKVTFSLVDSLKVDLPEEFIAVLEQDPEGI
jgi:hypothetical protein